MTLSPGTKLGLYEFISPLGKGGMSEVCRAKDTRLDREVAIKALPKALTRDPERDRGSYLSSGGARTKETGG